MANFLNRDQQISVVHHLAEGNSLRRPRLAAAVALYLSYYNFCWRPRRNDNSGRLRPSPAVMAG